MSRRSAALLVVLVLAASACGSGDTSPGATSSPESTVAPAVLECETLGYPCSLEDVPSEILQRSDELANQALTMFEDGSANDEVLAFLEAEDDVVEVEADDEALRFRVDGGRGTWVLRASAFATRSAPASPAGIQQLASSRPAQLRVVGAEAVEEKRALVLSAYEWQFGASVLVDDYGVEITTPDEDDGAEVAEVLERTRGYEGRVEFYGNAVPGATAVNVDSFRDWEAYDVVHVVSHGTRLCPRGQQPSSACRGAILAGLFENAEPGDGIEVYDALKGELKQRGLELAKAEGASRGLTLELPPTNHVLLTADFFRNEYRAGLDNTFVFFNACELLGVGGSDLVNAVKGSTSVVLGWTDNVFSDAAYTASLALYEDLADNGFAVVDAVEKLEGLTRDSASGSQLVISERPSGGDLRIREIVHVLNPRDGAVVRTGDAMGFQGTADDGEPDALPFSIDIDGIASEEAQSAVVHLSIDGDEVHTDVVGSGVEAEPGQWTVSGVADLGFDVEEGMSVTITATVDLVDDEGTSVHEVVVELVNEEPIMGRVWEFRGTSTSERANGAPKVRSVVLTFEFAPGQASDEPNPRYIATGGTLTYADATYRGLICGNYDPEEIYPVGPENLNDTFIQFDTTTSPIRYYGRAITRGLLDTYEGDCGGEVTQADFGGGVVFLRLSEEESQTVTGDSSITGIRADIRETGSDTIEWTVTRIS